MLYEVITTLMHLERSMASNVKSILLAGVGGQGTLLASEVLSEVLMLAGFDVKKSEIHGMSYNFV